MNIPLRYHVIICMLAAHLKKDMVICETPEGVVLVYRLENEEGGEEGVGVKGIWLCHNKSHVIPPLGSLFLFCLPFIGIGLTINSL